MQESTKNGVNVVLVYGFYFGQNFCEFANINTCIYLYLSVHRKSQWILLEMVGNLQKKIEGMKINKGSAGHIAHLSNNVV